MRKTKTSIQVEKETLKKLMKAKVYRRETYDDVVNRLLEKDIKKAKKELNL